MSKKIFAFLSLLVIASMMLAACGGGEATEAPAEAPAAPAEPTEAMPEPTEAMPEPTAVPPTEAPPAAVCEDAIGCVEIAADAPIKLAYALVIAGPNESLGLDSLYGVEIAVSDKGGTLLGHDILLVGEDTGCSAETGLAAATKLAADPTIVAVIGTNCSSEVRAGMPLFSQAGFSVVSPSNTAPDLTEAGNENNHPGYLRTAHNDKIQGAAAAKFAWEVLGVKKAATIHDGSIYADRLQQVFAEEFIALGGEITNQEAVAPEQTDMGPTLTGIAANAPELIYFPIFLPAGGFVIRQAKETAGLETTILMGADGLFSPDVVEAGGDAVEGFYVSSPFVSGAEYDAFVAKYQEVYGKLPISIFHAHAYDAANMIMGAIEQVAIQNADGSLLIPRQALRDALYATKDYQGLTGLLTCTPTGDCANPIIGVYQYAAGVYPPTLVWPK